MLGKVMKYEWKETSKMSGLLLILIAAVTLIGVLGFVLPVNYLISVGGDVEDTVGAVFMIFLMTSSLILYIFMMMGVLYGLLIYQGVRFYKTMYGDEGYLTHTLPVKAHHLLLGKTLVGGIWYLVVEIAIGLSVILLVAALLFAVGSASPDVVSEIADAFAELRELDFEFLPAEARFALIHECISFVLLMLVIPFSTLITLFGSLTIGQLSRKYKALMGILAYFGVLIVRTALAQVVQFFVSFAALSQNASDYYTGMTGNYTAVVSDSNIILQALMGAGMYLVALLIVNRKLNLE